jgi:hypothetical protein
MSLSSAVVRIPTAWAAAPAENIQEKSPAYRYGPRRCDIRKRFHGNNWAFGAFMNDVLVKTRWIAYLYDTRFFANSAVETVSTDGLDSDRFCIHYNFYRLGHPSTSTIPQSYTNVCLDARESTVDLAYYETISQPIHKIHWRLVPSCDSEVIYYRQPARPWADRSLWLRDINQLTLRVTQLDL